MSTQFTVSWNSVPGAIDYVVVATPENPTLTTRMSSGPRTTQTVDSLEPSSSYNVTVRAIYNEGSGPDSNVLRQTTGKVFRFFFCLKKVFRF